MRPRVLLALPIVAWALSWPAIKVGVASVPPIWYACFRYAIAAACLFALLAAQRKLAFPPRQDWTLVAVSGAFQMAAYSALTAYALTILPPGRASVLAFSTPIWVVPAAAWWLRERMSPRGLLGVGLGVAGALAIAGPSLHANAGREMLGYGLLLVAAAAWAISIVAVRAHRFASSTLALAPWQMLLAACLLLPPAAGIEGGPRPLGAAAAASLAYVGTVATAFAYWAVVEAGSRVPATTLSMALLATPALGILLSAVLLGESIGASLVAGVVLVCAGIRLASVSRRAS
jgi:drug/metabolite transporter (DMT)-like permease